jgi:hypothetical protein
MSRLNARVARESDGYLPRLRARSAMISISSFDPPDAQRNDASRLRE